MSANKQAKSTKEANDSNIYPSIQVTYLEKLGDAVLAYPYGAHGSPPVASTGLLLTIGKDEAVRYFIPLSALSREKGLKESEYQCGNFIAKSTIKFLKNGDINVVSVKDINVECADNITVNATNITVNAATKLTINAPDTDIAGDIAMVGDLIVTGKVASNGIDLEDHLHGEVESGTDNTGEAF